LEHVTLTQVCHSKVIQITYYEPCLKSITSQILIWYRLFNPMEIITTGHRHEWAALSCIMSPDGQNRFLTSDLSFSS